MSQTLDEGTLAKHSSDEEEAKAEYHRLQGVEKESSRSALTTNIDYNTRSVPDSARPGVGEIVMKMCFGFQVWGKVVGLVLLDGYLNTEYYYQHSCQASEKAAVASN